jgi:hypothetical protein
MVVVFSEASFFDRNTVDRHELHSMTEVARLFGCRVFSLPPNFDLCETAENALAYVPEYDQPTIGIWIGYIPTAERYSAIYNAALLKNIHLINSPDQYQNAMDFERFYPRLENLTPESIIITKSDELSSVINKLGFPVFVKGAIKSNKDEGWSACVANNESELESITERLFKRTSRSRGRVIIRKLVKLRTIATDYQSFPLGREYRVFLYKEDILAYGFYWEEYTDLCRLSSEEDQLIKRLAIEAARRVGTPFIAVDIGQLESGEWIVIEVGDGQFCGLSKVPVLELWGKLKNVTIV